LHFTPILSLEMPTRIILNDAAASRNIIPRYRSTKCLESADAFENRTNGDPRHTSTRTIENPQKRKSSRKVVQLKASLIRDKKLSDNFRTLSSEDIRASPRLLGYCFQLLASIVMLISVSTFLGEDEGENYTEIWKIFNRARVDSKELYYSNESRAVFAWKLFGCFAVSGFGTIITLAIILVHFDTIFFPSYWHRNFRDGSKQEQILLITLGLFWGFGLHINTSSLSVGQSQANVFFTSWISFFSAVLNYGIWRISAERRSIADMINEHHRETTYNWLWVLLCSLVFTGAICDTYLNREFIKLYFQGQELKITEEGWKYILVGSWSVVSVSAISIVLNHFLRKSCELRVYGGKFVLLGWRQAEGLVAFVMTVGLFSIVMFFTGGNGVFNGLNNVYFGIWGAFMNSVVLLATWLRENKNIESIKKIEKTKS